ncbi:hypothetical protein ANCDUO_07320 [Ancylostoma duodenale]|uniref:Asc-type amino acid transporter 1 domain protein n=1 Tax=Ancylostoma duodenale TaxID=51022 RepID=A0A0C2DIU1_9BILA|nr:hypothetical protein ANCDUO_07320 [Ancylostoma duodenale]
MEIRIFTGSKYGSNFLNLHLLFIHLILFFSSVILIFQDTGKGLARTLTLTNSVTMIVGCIIGSGIFVSPTGVQEAAGSVGSSLIIWVLCGLWCGLGAYIYAELGTLITKSGGDYAYIMEAFGPFIGFLRLWIESMVVRPCALTIVGLTFALYMLRPIYPDCDPPAGSKELLAAVMISTSLSSTFYLFQGKSRILSR